MTNLDAIAELYEQFKLDAINELEKCHKLFVYENDCYFGVVIAPTEKAEKRLLRWYESNRRPNDRLEPTPTTGVLDLLLTTDMAYEVKAGCQWIEC